MPRLITGTADKERKKFSLISYDDNISHKLSIGDLDRFSYTGKNFSFSSESGSCLGFFLSFDGRYAYMIASTTIYQYNLSTRWDISTASYSSKSFVYANSGLPNGNITPSSDSLFISRDGINLYVIESSGDRVHKFVLTTPWDISTAGNLVTRIPSMTGGTNPMYDVRFGDNGNKVYYIKYGSASADVAYQYSLSIPYNLNTASYDSKSFTFDTYDNLSTSLFFKSDGTKLYVCGDNGNEINEFNLTTAWDISTASYTSTLSISAETTSPRFFVFKSDGTKGYLLSLANTIYQYSFSTAWDITTGTYDSVSFSTATQDASTVGIAFKPDGTKMYTVGNDNDLIYEYDLSTAWDISTASYSTSSYNVSAYVSSTRGVDISSDGKIFMVGDAGNTTNPPKTFIAETPWDVSSISPSYFYIGSQDVVPEDIWFKSDGTKMYMLGGSAPNKVYQYTLSIPWQISTASYDSISLTAIDSTTRGITFNYLGTRLYIIGSSNDQVHQYNLTTPWDLSTASLVTTYNTTLEYFATNTIINEATARSIFINEEEDRIYISGDTSDKAFQFNLMF